MYEFKCAYCGRVKTVQFKSRVGRFCSRKCTAIGKFGLVAEDYDAVSEANVPFKESWGCQFNDEIFCGDGEKHCNRCGWNPQVAERRLKAICEKRKNGGIG